MDYTIQIVWSCIGIVAVLSQGCSLFSYNCADLQSAADGNLKSHTYSVFLNNSMVLVYCDFKQDHGYVYLNPGMTDAINLKDLYDNTDHVIIRHKRANGKQYSATMEQLSAFSNIPLSIQFNEHSGYQGPLNKAMSPYVFLGFIPKAMTSKRDVQGWKVNGKEFTFTNCDGNPNSYFAFLFNNKNASYTNYRGGYNALMFAWYNHATELAKQDYLPDWFYVSDFEIHHGGCGGYSIAPNKQDITGVALGLQFKLKSNKTCQVPEQIQGSDMTYTGLAPGNSVTYTCQAGYHWEKGDLYRECSQDGEWLWNPPVCRKQENCLDLLHKAGAGGLPSGEYTLYHSGQYITVYCHFDHVIGYTYLSPQTSGAIDIDMLYDVTDHVLIRHRRSLNDQYKTAVKQLGKFSSVPLSMQFNSFKKYQAPQNIKMGPYMYAGFVPKSEISKGGFYGWNVNGTDYTFINCDGNGNNYFVVYFNQRNNGYSSSQGSYNQLTNAWYNAAHKVAADDTIPDVFFARNYEVHHGGCGGFSTALNMEKVTGVAIGLPFKIICSIPEAVEHSTWSLTGTSPGNVVTYTCHTGFVLDGGDTVRKCQGHRGWSGTKPKCRLPINCRELRMLSGGNVPSGEYIFQNGDNHITAYCLFEGGHGYAFLSPGTTGDLNLELLHNAHEHVIIRHRRSNGDQYSAYVEQLSRLAQTPVSVQFNNYTGYKRIVNAPMGPYIYVGFIPKRLTSKNSIKGWKVNGQESTFRNCDGNGNSYFAVLLNHRNTGYASYNLGYNALMYAWYDRARKVGIDDQIPDKYFVPDYEIHHGGCGGFSILPSKPGITGVAVGLMFEY